MNLNRRIKKNYAMTNFIISKLHGILLTILIQKGWNGGKHVTHIMK
jgi:hypothetical protein